MNEHRPLIQFRSIKVQLLLLLLGITVLSVMVMTAIAVNSTQSQGRTAENLSSQALTSQARNYLLELTRSNAEENDLILSKILQDAKVLASYTENVFDNPTAFATNNYLDAKNKLIQGEDGQYLNSMEDASSLFIPVFTEINESTLREAELSAYLDFLFESIMTNHPNADAIYLGTASGITRYYPNIGLGNLVPPDFDVTQRVWYTGSLLQENPERKPWWTPVYADATGLGLVTTAAIPVYDQQQNLLGVIGIDVTLTDMAKNIEQTRLLTSGYSFLLDNNGNVIALPDQGYIDILGASQEVSGVNANLLESPTGFRSIIEKMMSGQTGVDSINVNDEALFIAYSPLRSTNWSLGSVVKASDVLQSVILLQQEVELSTTSLLLTRILPASLAILVIVVIISLMMTQRLVNPIHSLVSAAEKLKSGQWDVEIPATGAMEIGALAEAFSEMSTQLYTMVRELEDRVLARTRDLERRSTQLQVAAEIARDSSGTRKLDVLLNRAVTLVRDRFGFYHAGIFLVDTKNEFAILRAATGDAGQVMLSAGHKLKVGAEGIVGSVTVSGRPRISLDVGDDAVHFKNPLLPETRSEMALPLKTGEHIIGALDVQSREPSAFDQDDIHVLQIMADQLAMAIENARLFQEVQSNLHQLQALYGRYNQEAWRRLENTRNIIGYQYEATSGVIPIHKSENDIQDKGGEDVDAAVLKIPIAIRGQTIGALDVWSQRSVWTSDEVTLLNALADRIGQALESARLFEETQARASREETLNQLAAGFTKSLDFETLLQTAVKELGQLPNISEVSIYVGSPQVILPDNGSEEQ
jgi:GAF domain-containing protein/HAMP domain-containing protein